MSSSSQAGLLAEIDRLGTNMLTVEAGRSFTEQKALVASRGIRLDEQIANARDATVPGSMLCGRHALSACV